MILSPHLLLKAKGGRYVVVIRHPIGVKPNALQHDVVFIVGKLARSQKLSDANQIENLLAEARTWIDTYKANLEALPAVPGYSLIDRLKRHKLSFRDSRNNQAALIHAARRGVARETLEAEFGCKAVSVIFKRWPRLRARYPHRTQRKRGGSQITTGGSASKTLLITVLDIAAALKKNPGWQELAAVLEPPLGEVTVLRYLDLLCECFRMRIDKTRAGPIVLDWGILREDRL